MHLASRQGIGIGFLKMNTNQASIRIAREYKVQYSNPLQVHAGEKVSVGREDKEFPHWRWCKARDGREGWVPSELLGNEGPEAVVLQDYSARELAVHIGEDVLVEDARHNWLLVRNRKGERGWIPASHTRPQQ